MKTLTVKIILASIFFGLFSCKHTPSVQNNQHEDTSISNVKSVEVFGEKMHYIEKGQGELVILVHGAIGDYNAWRFQIDTLAQNYRAIAISRRYAWPNSQPGPNDSFDCSVSLHSRDLVEFMNQLNLESAHLMGHSYGAMIVLKTAIDHPTKVNSLILGEPLVSTLFAGTKVGDSLITNFNSGFDKAVDQYSKGKQEEAIRTFLIMVIGNDIFDDVPKEVQDGWLQNMVEGICIADTKDFSSILVDDLTKLNIPTLLVKGDSSPMILKMTADSLDAILSNSELSILQNTSHGLQGENPEGFNKAALKFYDRIERQQDLKAFLKTMKFEDDYGVTYIDKGKGDPIVFVHGTVGDYRVWNNQVDSFSKNYRTVALSRRNANPNKTFQPDSSHHSIPRHAEDLVGFLQELNLGPVNLVGHSYGAFTSLLATLEHPELVKTLTLGEPPVSSMIAQLPIADSLMGNFVNNAMIPAYQEFNENNDERAIELFLTAVLGDSMYAKNAPNYEREIWLNNTAELKAIVSGANMFPQLSCEDMDELKLPVLLLKGENSPINLRLIIDELHQCIKNSKMVELQNISHGLQIEDPLQYNQILLDFIDDH